MAVAESPPNALSIAFTSFILVIQLSVERLPPCHGERGFPHTGWRGEHGNSEKAEAFDAAPQLFRHIAQAGTVHELMAADCIGAWADIARTLPSKAVSLVHSVYFLSPSCSAVHEVTSSMPMGTMASPSRLAAGRAEMAKTRKRLKLLRRFSTMFPKPKRSKN